MPSPTDRVTQGDDRRRRRTLLSDGDEVADLEEWPASWEKPATPQALIDKFGVKDGVS
jgi:hypothetical protein